MKRIAILVCLGLCLLCQRGESATVREYFKNKSGLEFYGKGDSAKAVEIFSEMLEKNHELGEVEYNLGNVFYHEEDYKEAHKNYLLAMEKISDNKDTIYYNLGNASFKMGNLNQAIEYYRKGLEINPNDMDSKYNLEVALLQKKERIPSQNQQQKEKDGKSEEDLKKDKDKSKPQEKESPEEKKAKNQEEAQADEEKKGKTEEDLKKEQAKENIERILNSLDQKENDARKKYLQKQEPAVIQVEKDW